MLDITAPELWPVYPTDGSSSVYSFQVLPVAMRCRTMLSAVISAEKLSSLVMICPAVNMK